MSVESSHPNVKISRWSTGIIKLPKNVYTGTVLEAALRGGSRCASADARQHHPLGREVMSASHLCHRDALTIAAHSTCPSSNWHTRIAPLILSPEMVMLNVGANKGFNLLEFVQRYSVTPSNLTHQRWYNLLVENGCKSQCCGVCRLCKARPISRQASASLKLHAFELQPANAALLQRMMAATGLPVMIHSTAVSNFTGTVYTAATVVAGSESFGLKHKQSKNDVAQPVTTIDAFLKRTGIERVHLVSIDTEGAYNRSRVLAHSSPVQHRPPATLHLINLVRTLRR